MLLEAISGNATDSREEEVDEVGAWEAPLASLLDTLTTLVVGLAVVCLLQLLLIALWKFWVNRRYYARQRDGEPGAARAARWTAGEPAAHGASERPERAPRRSCDGRLERLSRVSPSSSSSAKYEPLSEEEKGRRERLERRKTELNEGVGRGESQNCLLYTSPSPRDQRGSRMPSSA